MPSGDVRSIEALMRNAPDKFTADLIATLNSWRTREGSKKPENSSGLKAGSGTGSNPGSQQGAPGTSSTKTIEIQRLQSQIIALNRTIIQMQEAIQNIPSSKFDRESVNSAHVVWDTDSTNERWNIDGMCFVWMIPAVGLSKLYSLGGIEIPGDIISPFDGYRRGAYRVFGVKWGNAVTKLTPGTDVTLLDSPGQQKSWVSSFAPIDITPYDIVQIQYRPPLYEGAIKAPIPYAQTIMEMGQQYIQPGIFGFMSDGGYDTFHPYPSPWDPRSYILNWMTAKLG